MCMGTACVTSCGIMDAHTLNHVMGAFRCNIEVFTVSYKTRFSEIRPNGSSSVWVHLRLVRTCNRRFGLCTQQLSRCTSTYLSVVLFKRCLHANGLPCSGHIPAVFMEDTTCPASSLGIPKAHCYQIWLSLLLYCESV